MGFFGDIADFASDVAGGVANIAGDIIEGAGDLVGAAGNIVGAAGGLLGAALGGLGGLMEAGAGVLGGIFPPLGIAMSLAGLLTSGLGDVVSKGCKILQEVAQLPKFAATEMNDLIHTVTAQLSGGGQGNSAIDAAVNDKWGGQIKSMLDGIQQDFVDNVSAGDKKKHKSWIDVLVDGLKLAVQNSFDKMEESESKVTGNDSDSPKVMLDFTRDAKFFDLVMTTATQTIKDSLDAAKNMAQAA